MRRSLMGIARVGLATVGLATGIAGMADAQPSYPCAETNGNLPNPYVQVPNWASPPRPFMPVNAVAADANNNLWLADRCETVDCVPVMQLGPDGKTLKNFGAGLFIEPHQVAVDNDGNVWIADAGVKDAKGYQVTKFFLRRTGAPQARQARPGRAPERPRHLRFTDRRCGGQ